MSDDKMKEMVLQILKRIDYDIWKEWDAPEYPEEIDEQLDSILDEVVRKYIK